MPEAPDVAGIGGEPVTRGSPAAIRPGMRVKLPGDAGAGQTATVESVDRKGRAEVMVRGKRMTVRVSDLTPLDSEAPAAAGRLAWTLPPGVRFVGGRRESAPAEINLIGSTVEEALDRLDKFLDDSYLAGHSQVRVIHGHGTGRLRAAVQKMLKTHPHVDSQSPAEERAGGSGATVVTLRG